MDDHRGGVAARYGRVGRRAAVRAEGPLISIVADQRAPSRCVGYDQLEPRRTFLLVLIRESPFVVVVVVKSMVMTSSSRVVRGVS